MRVDFDLYKSQLKKYIVCPSDMYPGDINFDIANIFTKPIQQIFFWKDDIGKIFFSIYKHFDKYIVIYDFTGDILELLHEDTCEDILYEIILHLYKKSVIYSDLLDIHSDFLDKYNNKDLIESFDHFYKYINEPTYMNYDRTIRC